MRSRCKVSFNLIRFSCELDELDRNIAALMTKYQMLSENWQGLGFFSKSMLNITHYKYGFILLVLLFYSAVFSGICLVRGSVITVKHDNRKILNILSCFAS